MEKRSVLFVDDDPFFLDALGQFLEEHGYEVRRAADGLEALDAVRENPPDLILLDLIMPKIDGGRVSRYLREDARFQHIPIVIFSALAARDIAEIPHLSADAYVAKGPLSIVGKNVLDAFHHLELHGRFASLEEAVFGYEGFRPRRLVSELLSLRRDSDVLLQTMREGVLKADEDFRIFYVSPIALAVLATEERDLIGTKLGEIFGPPYEQEMARMTERLRADPQIRMEELMVNLKGRLLKARFAPLWKDEVFGGLLTLLEDVSSSRPRQTG